MKQMLLAVVVVVVAAMALGWLFARSDAPGAARLLLDDDVAVEELQESEPGPAPARPTSGPQRGSPTCGVLDAPPAPGDQVAALAAGVVIVHHHPDLDDDELAALVDLVDEHERVLVVPGAASGPDVVATAWRHRYEQDHLSATDLERFVVGWGGRGPEPRPCP